jgi:hypothetical protein
MEEGFESDTEQQTHSHSRIKKAIRVAAFAACREFINARQPRGRRSIYSV